MAVAPVDAPLVNKQFGGLLRNCLSGKNLDLEEAFTGVKTAFEKAKCVDQETKKLLFDQSFRDCLTNGYLSISAKNPKLDLTKCNFLLSLSIRAVRNELLSPTLPILYMSDVFDVLTLVDCEDFFSCVEDNVTVWKEPLFFSSIKNSLLRICNDLLRRLSRSQNTVFCGRILLFLAKFFPFSERSGLNIISEFNLDNTTVFSSEEETKGEEKMDVDEEKVINIEPDSKNLSIDYSLYSKFWQLQDFFRNPLQCYDKVKWLTFSKYSKAVLDTFKSFKIDSVAAKRRKLDVEPQKEMNYFAKYLTNQNLLQLQLSDSNFRRYILVQFLILFQYLQSSVKFKSESQVLNDEQSRWVEKMTSFIHELLEETPPEGKSFSNAVKHIIIREEQWNIWKNEGCQSLAIPKPEKKDRETPVVKAGSIRRRKRKIGDQIKEARSQNKFLMGNANLTRLWNICPDNLEAAAAPERDFLPSLEEYFAEAIEQLDPANQVEKEYQKVNDGQWGWRALRLLAKKSPFFFTYGNTPIAKLPEYLETMLKKMNPSLKVSSPGNQAVNGDAKKDNETPSLAEKPAVCTDDHLKKLAENVKDSWRKIIPKLGQSKEDVANFEEKESDDAKRALLMLSKWAKEEGEAATQEEITYVLEGLKMSKAINGVF